MNIQMNELHGINIHDRFWDYVNLSYERKGIMFKFIIEYNSLKDFGP
jgi:hypothetical protein